MQKFGSSSTKISFKVPKLSKPLSDSDKENIHSNFKDSFNLLGGNSGKVENVNSVDQSGKSSLMASTTRVPSGLKTLNIPSLMQQPNKVPQLLMKAPHSGNSTDSDEECSSLSALITQHASKKIEAKSCEASLLSKPDKIPPLLRVVPQASNDDSCADSEEECSSLSALMAQHASKATVPEHTSLSALANFHLKGNSGNSNVQPQSEFMIPSLKLQPKPTESHLMERFLPGEGIGNLHESSSADSTDERGFDTDNDGFVIDLLGALNPPDFRKQLERPSSRMDSDNIQGLHGGEDDEDSKPWIQDGSCVLDARPFLSIDLPWEQKLSSPVGRILCRRRVIRKLPYVRPTSPFMGNLVPFAFDTLSPDAVVRKSLRRV